MEDKDSVIKSNKEENPMGNILIQGYRCERCDHRWAPRKNENGDYERPRVCPRCKSAWWDVPKKDNGSSEEEEK